MVNENQQAIEKDGDDISYLSSVITRHDASITKVTDVLGEVKDGLDIVTDKGF